MHLLTVYLEELVSWFQNVVTTHWSVREDVPDVVVWPDLLAILHVYSSFQAYAQASGFILVHLTYLARYNVGVGEYMYMGKFIF